MIEPTDELVAIFTEAWKAKDEEIGHGIARIGRGVAPAGTRTAAGLNAVFAELDRTRDTDPQYDAGQTAHVAPAETPAAHDGMTTAEFAVMWNTADRAGQQEIVANLLEQRAIAIRCFTENHQTYSHSEGAHLIGHERDRQAAKGYTPEHDAGHALELLRASYSYAMIAASLLSNPTLSHATLQIPPLLWPWERHYWKPAGNPTRNAIKAGALAAAAIDELRREKAAQ